ncbi:MAG: cation:H+ antiporter [Oleiphilaceae bacterium]|jgi:cation:H+ antiporter
MLLPALAILVGFILLVWSADRFVDGAAATAKHMGLPSLLIGMVIVGFGTSAPEMVVSAMAAMDGNPALALGNGLGSNIVNISLILGTTALIAPMVVHSKIVQKEIPLLIAISLLTGFFLWDLSLTYVEALILLAGFFAVIGWSIYAALNNKDDALASEFDNELQEHAMTLGKALFWLALGLAVLVGSSRILVWGSVEIAQQLGVSDLIIGLTIVALGTSLPELAASVVAAKKGEHDIAIGNVIGSNMFNLLAVIGIAGTISPMTDLAPEVLWRDWSVMLGLIIMLLVMAYGFGKGHKITRIKGGILLSAYFAYNAYLIHSIIGA